MIENLKTKFPKRIMVLILLISIALFSIFVVSRIVTSPSFNAATAAASSTALSLIPGNVAMPIANQLAELSSYFIVILGAILLEKMLIAVVGYMSFKFIIPFACFLGILNLYIKKEFIKNLAIKLTIFAIVLFVAIPISIRISDLIDYTYQDSIEQTIESAEQNKEYIEQKKEDLSAEDKNWIEKVGEHLSNFTSAIGNGISEMIEKGEATLNSFLYAIAILIITSCVIPIAVLLIFAWIIKILFGFSVKIPRPNPTLIKPPRLKEKKQ